MHISYANGPIWHFGYCLIILTHLMTKESMQCKLQGVFVTSSTEASSKFGASFSESYVVLVCFDCLSLTRDDSRWFHLHFKWFQFRSPVSVLTKWPSLAALWGELWSDLAQWRLEGGEGVNGPLLSPFWCRNWFCWHLCFAWRRVYIYIPSYVFGFYIWQYYHDRTIKWWSWSEDAWQFPRWRNCKTMQNRLISSWTYCAHCAPEKCWPEAKITNINTGILTSKVVSCWLVARLQQSRHCIQVPHGFVLGMRFNVEKALD